MTPRAAERAVAAVTTWRLWFPVRLGPPRKKSKMVAGIKVTASVRSLEFPPGPNGSRGNHYGHARWVKSWRDLAADTAREHEIPQLGRARISAVFRRRALGTADEDNDRSRCKPLVDGLRDAGVLKKDTRDYVVYGPCTEERAADKYSTGILLIVEAVS